MAQTSPKTPTDMKTPAAVASTACHTNRQAHPTTAIAIKKSHEATQPRPVHSQHKPRRGHLLPRKRAPPSTRVPASCDGTRSSEFSLLAVQHLSPVRQPALAVHAAGCGRGPTASTGPTSLDAVRRRLLLPAAAPAFTSTLIAARPTPLPRYSSTAAVQRHHCIGSQRRVHESAKCTK